MSDDTKILIGINLGFITNSSSVVHHFPRELLDHPTIATFINAMGIAGGFVGYDMWSRSACATVALTKEQKQDVDYQMKHGAYGGFRGPGIAVDNDDEFVIVYGDEYESVAATLASMLDEVAAEVGIDRSWGESYN